MTIEGFDDNTEEFNQSHNDLTEINNIEDVNIYRNIILVCTERLDQ